MFTLQSKVNERELNVPTLIYGFIEVFILDLEGISGTSAELQGGLGRPWPTLKLKKTVFSTVAHCSVHCNVTPCNIPLLWSTLIDTVAPPLIGYMS
jgi:hypothetical protein